MSQDPTKPYHLLITTNPTIAEIDANAESWKLPYSIDDADLMFDGKPLNLLYEENRCVAESTVWASREDERERERERERASVAVRRLVGIKIDSPIMSTARVMSNKQAKDNFLSLFIYKSGMAILLTGGTGKTSLQIASHLLKSRIAFLLASRHPSSAPASLPAIRFNWLDPATFPLPFSHDFPGGETISAVYLIAPEVEEPELCMNAFVEYAARRHRVRRFVLLAGNRDEPGCKGLGMVWQRFWQLGVEYCVLRPTWFMGMLGSMTLLRGILGLTNEVENFLDEAQIASIRNENKIYTACGNGKVPFVSVHDIAVVAFHALTDEKSHNTAYTLLGRELLSHDDVAAKLSTCVGREIVHVKLNDEERCRGRMSEGLSENTARFLTSLETSTARGSEERMNDVVERITGRAPRYFDTFAEENKTVWQ
ncbi:hypothetical protein B7494_g3713 [Chlorociboria aeruginascens]|nr:hypothetical protein B7494_g3713 [Chlorociboria aeruginascens]